MTNKRYVAGANFERRMVRWYEEQGFDVIRSAGSHGPSDVTAFCRGLIFFNSLRIKPKWSDVERWEFEALCRKHDAVGRYVWRDDKNKIQFKEVE